MITVHFTQMAVTAEHSRKVNVDCWQDDRAQRTAGLSQIAKRSWKWQTLQQHDALQDCNVITTPVAVVMVQNQFT